MSRKKREMTMKEFEIFLNECNEQPPYGTEMRRNSPGMFKQLYEDSVEYQGENEFTNTLKEE